MTIEEATALLSPPVNYAHFLRPSTIPASGCNIWGPLCQTGFINIYLNLSSTITQTNLPCSDYLNAQSKSASLEYSLANWISATNIGYDTPVVNSAIYAYSHYRTSFGRSPECTSVPKAFKFNSVSAVSYDMVLTQPDILASFMNCGANHSGTLLPPVNYLPFGIPQSEWIPEGTSDVCCGICQADVEEVRLIYFPSKETTNCSHSHESNKVQSRGLISRAHSLVDGGAATMVSNGYTL